MSFVGPSQTLVAVAMLAFCMPALALPEGSPTTRSETPAANIVIGFVGGFVHHDNPSHGPVQLAQRIQRGETASTHVEVFENRHRKSAYQTVLRLLDTNRDGQLSGDEKRHARIVIFGHSWGAAAAVLLARDLEREHIPVLLTVQVDSVAKLWQNDAVIPENVAEAANFYQTHGMVHGRARITAADPLHTQILGNYRFDYAKQPVQCPAPSWFDRHVAQAHSQSECDPALWSEVENLVRQSLSKPSSNPPGAEAHLQTVP